MLKLDRIDLADLHAPDRLARAIHRQLGHASGPVPVTKIARALDIEEVVVETLDGCEGILLTDRVRSRGRILVNGNGGHRRTRFSIGHELGHFLMERHVLSDADGFMCDRLDMRELRGDTIHRRQEREANAFSIALLAPPHLTWPLFDDQPDINLALRLRDRLDISLEASTRCLVDRHDEPLAAVWSKHGRIQYVVRGPRFPWILRGRGEKIPDLSATHRALSLGCSGLGDMTEVAPAAWTDREIAELFEQVRLGQEGRVITLLWASLQEPEEG